VDAAAKTISCTVTNNGTRGYAGQETAQLYLRFPSSAGEPPSQLKGWAKLPALAPGASTRASFSLADSRSFSIWDTQTHAWKFVDGEFGVMVGASSADIRLSGTVSSGEWVD
jgi:beta-glucosidase